MHDILPPPPSPHLRQPVRAHQPDKAHMRKKLLQAPQRIDGIARADAAFDIGGQQPASPHAMDTLPHQRQPLRQRGHARHRLERIARRDKKPDLIQFKLAQGPAGKLDVTVMHRVE